jgi:hypothetical protein
MLHRAASIFIVMWLPLFGLFFSIALGCLGLCLDVSLICMIVGGPLVGQGALRCGKCCLRAAFGVYGRKRMIEISRRMRGLWVILFLCYLKLCIFGRRRMFLLCRLVLLIFFFVLPFIVRLFLFFYFFIFFFCIFYVYFDNVISYRFCLQWRS